MGTWDDYKRDEAQMLEPGDYRVEIVDVEDTVSKKGNPMIVITVRPNNSKINIKHYIVKNEYFNRNMTNFFDSFNIGEGDFRFITWIGAVGAAHLKEDEHGYLKVAWFINQKKAEKLPSWVGQAPERQIVSEGFTEVDDDEMPF